MHPFAIMIRRSLSMQVTGWRMPVHVSKSVSYTHLNDVDVNEIESISVLKDASATAVYGVKGANGVRFKPRLTDMQETIIQIADGTLGYEELVAWIEEQF